MHILSPVDIKHKVNACIVLPSLKVSGGIGEAIKLGRDLQAFSADVNVLAFWLNSQGLSAIGLKVRLLSCWEARRMWAPFQMPWLLWRFWKLSRQPAMRQSVWIFTHYVTLPMALIVPRRNRWFFVQDLEWTFVGNSLLADCLKRILLAVYRRSHLLSANDYLHQALRQERLAPVGVAAIWADPDFAQKNSNKVRDIDVLMVLRKGAHKRLDLYLEAIAYLQLAKPDLHLTVITTEDTICADVKPLVNECCVRPNRAQMKLLYARAKTFLLLSEHEGFALPPLEAMGAGCVPICRDSGGPQAYMVADLNSCLLPRNLSLGKVCDTVICLLNDPARWHTLSASAHAIFQRGLTRARERFVELQGIFPECTESK